jgi:hypothetical protein
MEKKLIIENIVKKIKSIIINERKSDQLSMQLSRLTVNQFKKNEDFTLESIQFERGDEYANFDFICTFIADENFNFPFSVRGGGDMQTLEIEITYRPDDFPKHMTDLVAEIKETIEHELEHIEQQNFDDMYVDDEDIDEDDNFEYLTSSEEVPAYVRGLIKRSKTKRISLLDAMEEWFSENKLKFKNPKKEWPLVKKIWTDYANEMRSKERIKKFK